MGKRLIVAEKPSVGREIAKVLGCRENVKGAIIGKKDVVTWASGHLVEQCMPEEMDDRYKDWRLEDLPIIPNPIPLKVLKGGEKQFNIIKTWMHDPEIDSIVCATDAGREGELIFRYIYLLAECNKPVRRLWISSLTYSSIKKGFENLKGASQYNDLYLSARCRSEADWLIGINGSRAFSITNNKRSLSVGRVTSPTLAILVNKELERRNFKPEEFCELVISYGQWEGKLVNQETKGDPEKWSRFGLNKKTELEQFAAGYHPEAMVIFAESKEEAIQPPLLYDLTSLQRDANRLYNYSSKFTLDMAQKLYENKAITYPRTDSRYLPSDMKSSLNKCLQRICIGDLAEYALPALNSQRNLFGRFISDKGVSDHHAIIPTGEAKDIDKWSRGERSIYYLIVRRFIGMFLPDRVVKRQKLITCINNLEFRSCGEKVVFLGWSSADYSYYSFAKELPDVNEGDKVTVKGMRVRMDQTKPPAPHTEASLLNAMEHAGKIVEEEMVDAREKEYGIGTPATRADIIEKLLEKRMVERRGRALIPTEYGIKLIEILPDYLRSPEMTGEWEARLSRISKGDADARGFIEDIRKQTEELVAFAAQQGDQGLNDANVVGVCPICGHKVREYPNAYYCENKECGFRCVWKAKKGAHPTLTRSTMEELLRTGKARTDKGIFTLTRTESYISFERSERPETDFGLLFKLIADYGLKPVNKVLSGGALWFEGTRGDETMKDFASECNRIGCPLQFAKDARALKHKSGWYLEVKPQHIEAFKNAFGKDEAENDKSPVIHNSEDIVLDLVKESGFEYIDKRENKGVLWIIADEEEAKDFVKKCESKGIVWAFVPNGSRATKRRPGWYCR